MKKIPTLFERTFANHRVTGISDKVTPGCEWVLAGEGVATIKVDGACCAVINGEFYKRYDARKGKVPPAGAIPCCDPDPVTGHWPHWVKVNMDDPADKWYCRAFLETLPLYGTELPDGTTELPDGTYEAVGPHFQGNPYSLASDRLIPHGIYKVYVPRTFEGVRKWLEEHYVEGLVFWHDGKPGCKIKRSDFGFAWGNKKK